jgi:hypothetical protein
VTALRAGAPRVLAVGPDAELCAALHRALEGAGHALWCVPSPADLEPALRLAAPSLVLLLLPPTPDPSWGAALSAAAGAAGVGVRVVVVAPLREVVEPLAAVAGAERALSRAELLASPLAILERPPLAPPAPPARLDPPSARAPAEAPAPAPRRSALFDEELDGEARPPPRPGRVEVSVSLVSEHNFYVGATRRLDSGGVFVSTAVPPPVGTRLEVRLGLADGRKVDLEGEVVFLRERSALGGRQPSGCGLRLLGMPGWAIDAVERFMLARQPIVWVGR